MANENRLINTNAALEKLCEYCSCGCYEECDERFTEFFDISNIPTVDAVEVVHGHWTTLYTLDTWMGTSKIDSFICSECGVSSKRKGNYCPNCGAKMDGGNEDV